MADPLSLLRQFNVNKREIAEKNSFIYFGDNCWPKTVKTNYLVYGSTRDGPNKEFYTLECLLFFLKNVSLPHPAYVKQAAAENIPVVRRPDRKDLLAYLFGETVTSGSIDKSAPIELPISSSDLHKSETEAIGASKTTILGQHSSGADNDGPTPSKMGRLEMQKMQELRKQFSARLDAPKFKKPTAQSLSAHSLSDHSANSTSLRDAMSNDQIAALKAKRLAKKRSTIIDADSEFEAGQNTVGGSLSAPSAHTVLLEFDANFTKEIQNKERIWRNRSNILQSTGKNFQKSIFPILASIKSREDGNRKPNPAPVAAPAIVPTAPTAQRIITPSAQLQQQQAQQQYNRYDQERFSKNDTIGFRIDTTGTYHGLTLKSVTEGSAQPKTAGTPGTPYNQIPQQVSTNPVNNKGLQKRTSRTPIIIIPATTTSLITMYNAKAILQELRFVDGKVAPDQRRENELLIQRKKPDNTTVPYRVIDDPMKKLTTLDDWNRVVAVFVQGPAWQFKGWPWTNPVEIFDKIKAFHLKFDEMKLDANVAKWSVEVIELSRTKRHLDRANLLKFWSLLDAHIDKYKRNILRY